MESLRIEVVDQSQVAAARRAVVALGAEAGLDESDQGRLAIVVTEAATNQVKHARQGEIIARAFRCAGGAAVELIAIDCGDGMAQPARAFMDGFSTVGTPGNGLGAIRRLADSVDFHSSPRGVVIAARIQAGGQARVERTGCAPGAGLDASAVCVRFPGETACGDDWAVVPTGTGWLAVVVDGLGHGPLAAQAARAALSVIDPARPDPRRQMQALHDALRGGRGAAAGIAFIEPGRVGFCGVGNVVCRILDAGHERQLVTHAGIVGQEMRKVQVFEAAAGPGALVVLHSDGLTTQCAVQREPGLEHRTPPVIAGVLFRNFVRGRDDATVLVARLPQPGAA